MIQTIKSWMDRNKVSVVFVGGALVIITQWAKCSIEPNLVNPAINVEDTQDVEKN